MRPGSRPERARATRRPPPIPGAGGGSAGPRRGPRVSAPALNSDLPWTFYPRACPNATAGGRRWCTLDAPAPCPERMCKMRRLGLAVLLAAGCIHGAPRQDDRAIRAIGQQESWAQQAISTRPSRAELDAVRSGDFNAVGRARTAFRRLIQAIDRGTWIRNTASQLMVDDPDPLLPTSFDRAGRLRFEAIQAADEVSSALAEAKGGLSIADLQPGFEAIRKAQASEDRIARLPPRPGALRLAPAPLPVPRAFIASAARIVSRNPE